MDVPLAIAHFIDDLEKGLETVFARQQTDHTILLSSLTPRFTLIIYLAGHPGRIRSEPPPTIHVDQDQILRDRPKLLSRLFSLFGKGRVVYARQTVVARTDKRIALAFLEDHHLQVAIPGKYRYGLYEEGELVSVAVFSGGRSMREQAKNYRSFELLRFCHKSGCRVVGGLSKLLKSFVADFHAHDIMTYVDRDWAQDSNLRTLGFQEQGHTAPQAFWIAGTERHPTKSAEDLAQLEQTYPQGYLLHNQGSTKLVLKL